MRFGRQMLAEAKILLILTTLFGLTTLVLNSDLLAAQSSNIFKVSKLAVEATENSAVEAKNKAISEGERRALQVVLRRLVPFSGYSRLPQLEPSAITRMVQGFSVRKERYSSTQYLATLDISFQPGAVRNLLSSYEIPFIEKQSQRVVVVPALVSAKGLDRSALTFWRKAWLSLDLENAITPIKLDRVNANLTEKRIKSVLGGDRDIFETVRNDYGERYLVLAVGELVEDGSLLKVRLLGTDEAGRFDLVRTYRIYDDRSQAADLAAKVSLGILEGRWKEISGGVISTEAGAGQSSDIFLTAEFSGFSQWQSLRAKLSRVPGIQSLNISSLSARGAEVTLIYPGGVQRLRRDLVAYGLSLENVQGAWILKSF